MKCTDKERMTCRVEKMGCKGCHYDDIEIGEYIRNNQGYIDKVKKIIEKDEKMHNNYYCCESTMASSYKDEIVKHSKNIIDLIEHKDIAELEYYVSKYGKRISRKFEVKNLNDEVIYFDNTHCSFCYDLKLRKWIDGKGYNPKIKTILTHEQFAENSYKI